MAIIEFISV